MGPETELNGGGGGGGGGLGFHSIRDRFPLKRSFLRGRSKPALDRPSGRNNRGLHHARFNRKVQWLGKSGFYLVVISAVFLFAMASMLLQSSIMSFFKQSHHERGRSLKEELRLGTTLKFVPSRRFEEGLDRTMVQRNAGIRQPRLAVILGNLKKGPQSLMLFTVMKNIKELGYMLKIYAVENGEAHSSWEQMGNPLTILAPENYAHIDWLIYEGVIVDSLEAKDAVTSLMQEPFCSVPLVLIIQEDSLANRLPAYEETGRDHLLSYWRSYFSRANAVVFPDYTLPMLYSVLDTGNFFVIPGSPVDVWAAESYSKTHSKDQLRTSNGYNQDDMLIVVVGSSFFYNELSWDYAVAMHSIGPLLIKYARRSDSGESFKFIFLCGNSTDEYNDALQEAVLHLGIPQGSVRHYGLNGDVTGILLMADIVLYGSSNDGQGFPPLLARAMTLGIPVIAPDIPVLKEYVVDGVHVIFYPKHNPDALMRAFSLLISDGKLSKFGQDIASSGKLLAKNMLASKSIKGYTSLLESVLTFPSDSLLPHPVSQLKQYSWEWNLFPIETNLIGNLTDLDDNGVPLRTTSLVYALEEDLTSLGDLKNVSEHELELAEDIPTELDWAVVSEIEASEEYERVETEEIKERMEENTGNWDEIYRNARKSEKLKSEANERDEGELERTGQPVCIYEIYDGSGSWPFLHHGSLYRGLSLSPKSRRLRSDDINAVSRLPLLNDSYFRDILCELGGMFSIANKVDDIHKRPWIGFQSWRTAGRKVSLSKKAEEVLEDKIKKETLGDRIYFWVLPDLDSGVARSGMLNFWSMCDTLNGGNCRTAFEDAFRHMYGLPSHMEALPPMPEDGGYWSSMHSWVMPSPSYLEFIMFARIFTDSLHTSQTNSTKVNKCLLGSSEFERKHCYCRILELLVNVWAYHSARKMFYIEPDTGILEEQHPIEQRVGHMWAKYFNSTLLKSMDEELAETADDGDFPAETWLWPLTGEVHWQGVYEREREERYRLKMDKKRKTKKTLYERMKHGYQQKSLG